MYVEISEQSKEKKESWEQLKEKNGWLEKLSIGTRTKKIFENLLK